jgi:DnaJ domain
MLLKKNDYYATLQVHPKAVDAVIAKAYRELCKLYHPDAGGSVEQMRRLNEAYEVLSDPERRAAYDLQSGRLPWRRKAEAPARKPAPRRPDVGLPWYDPAAPARPLAWVKGGPQPGRTYPFEKPGLPWDKPFDQRHGRVVECAGCQAQVLVVFKPDGRAWKVAIASIDEVHCRHCGHHAACYECAHAESRMALEVRMQVVSGCVPLTSLWMAVR